MGSKIHAPTAAAWFSLVDVMDGEIGGTGREKLRARPIASPYLIYPQNHSSKEEITKPRAVLIRMLVALAFVSLFFLAGCGGSGGSTNQPPPNQSPSITTISPNTAAAGGAPFTLTINGTNFMAASMVKFGGTPATTTFVSGTQLTAAIPAAAIASAGMVGVTVTNPAPGGGTSNAMNFTISNGTNSNNGTNPFSVAVAPDPTGKFGKFAYVVNSGSNDVSMYSIDAATGALEPMGTVAAGSSPRSVALDPSGKFAYVANYWSENVSIYGIDAPTGTLMPRGTTSAGGSAISVTVHPSGKFAYVGHGFNCPNDSVSIYTVDTNTGALTSVGAIPAVATEHVCSFAVWITIDRSGSFAYVSGDNCIDGDHSYVSIDTINSTTGALTPAETIASPTCSGLLSVDPFSKFAYLPNWDKNFISMYSIDGTTGALSLIRTTPAGSSPTSIAIHPSGKFAYATNFGSNDVSIYSIDATGALSLLGTIPAGSSPRRCAIDPSGKFAYVVNSGSNDVSMYSIDAATGALTLIGTVGT